jgi:hypothetical protein
MNGNSSGEADEVMPVLHGLKHGSEYQRILFLIAIPAK